MLVPFGFIAFSTDSFGEDTVGELIWHYLTKSEKEGLLGDTAFPFCEIVASGRS